ncbi:MAG: helix-turn-helix domain-containing protein [Chloroflexi bacterium]|nr:MAG: helix-turn-helix domain-containing protein [Chloroflexota bacterium]
MESEDYKVKIGNLIQESRQHRGYTQAQLAEALGTSQSAINRIEKGGQNISLEMIARISDVLSHDIMTLNHTGKINFRVNGGKKLSGEIEIKTSKNAAVALLCASLLNKGKTTLRRVARIEEVNRIIEVLQSIGVKVRWMADNDLEITPPKRLLLENMDIEAAKRTRTVIMFLGPLLHQYNDFKLPFAGGCNLGKRTVEPHMTGLRPFGLDVEATTEYYHAVTHHKSIDKTILLTERGDTVTENVLMAAALYDGKTVIRNASPNYMVQDLCFFLQKLGVQIDGIGSTTLTVHGVKSISKDVEYFPSEDPIEAMSFVAAAVVTDSEITIRRVPIEFFTELSKLNAQVELLDPHRVYITGPTKWKVADVVAPPALRPSVVVLLAMLAAPGHSILRDVYSINRGYEDFANRLNSLGAEIETIREI